eukprot:CAMPEP_0204094372 /NCGR_PEP_ID=MMETSP0360-20130528/190894_1 /ASSEMBLY_ACC=CAM_ASM_000342 /TAXON_ID=268821 /ORGANISM="Scrippsiella Hangoei, Strain SHTV-5" /LENGTH=755 /DNA_ID=CAMNT_0051043683 /DNA_START=79 /DNA_END=2346 /DNA_ORIENTATION=-
MKCGLVLAAMVLVVSPFSADAVKFQQVKAEQKTPMAQVVQLLTGMKARIEADGQIEQSSYDKYACWCESTLARKAKDISEAKAKIEELQALVIKLKAEIASHGAEIKQLEKDIAQNIEAQGEAKAVRDNEFEDYNGEKTENEQCIGALEAAVKALAGAGAGKFLETGLKEAQLLSVVAGVRSVLEKPSASRSLSDGDMKMVQHFVERPDDFSPRRGATLSAAQVGNNPFGDYAPQSTQIQGILKGMYDTFVGDTEPRRGATLSAAQVGNNPFGDYAPQSTQIQGILKGMYDTFVGDTEKANAKEADAQKAFEELMATKLRELETLEATLKQQELDEAQKSQTLAESEELMDATKAQLEADEKFFDQTKAACQVKASEWSERTRLRTMELQGVNKAIEILSSPDAMKTFTNATTTFVQLSSLTHHRTANQGRNVYKKLSGLARRFHDLSLAELAAKVKAGGHFDKVIISIDTMMEVLRAEEQSDIEHRDRCENADGKNTNDMEDLNHAIDKSGKTIEHLGNEEERLLDDIEVLEAEIKKTKEDMDEALALRNNEVAEFRQAMKDDTDAIALLQQAMAALRHFFDKNNIKLELLATKAGQEPEYSVDRDKAPETSWSGPNYTGRKEESGGIVAILEMCIEDLDKEIKTGQADDAEAQKMYEGQRGAMQNAFDAQMGTKLATEKELADVRSQKNDAEEFNAQKGADLVAEKDLKDSIYSDCSWVKTHFQTRRDKRKSEMDGLVEAKGYLAGVMKGDDV